jgi:hypothetical protein
VLPDSPPDSNVTEVEHGAADQCRRLSSASTARATPKAENCDMTIRAYEQPGQTTGGGASAAGNARSQHLLQQGKPPGSGCRRQRQRRHGDRQPKLARNGAYFEDVVKGEGRPRTAASSTSPSTNTPKSQGARPGEHNSNTCSPPSGCGESIPARPV